MIKSAKPVRGTRDILPEEMRLRHSVEQDILKTFEQAGFEQIETPALESLDLLMGSDGGDNLKMLFTITKRGDKFRPAEGSTVEDLCDTGLRFDLTLPLTRYYSNNKDRLDLPFKSIQIGNVFRAERPQKGRFRSFKQCDIDIIGDDSIGAEIDLIHTTAQALLNVGFMDFTIKINDRRLLNALIEKSGFKAEDVPSVAVTLDKLDKIGKDGVIAELIEKGYDESTVRAFTDTVSGLTLEDVRELTGLHTEADNLKKIIDTIAAGAGLDYNIVFDFSLIRGMGYYTGPVFEVRWGDVGYSIAGGGRYDNMIGKTSKESVPAVGFSIGFERIVDILSNLIGAQPDTPGRVLLLCRPDRDDMAAVLKKADELRGAGFSVAITPARKKVGRQIQRAEEKGCDGVLVFGRDEAVRFFNDIENTH